MLSARLDGELTENEGRAIDAHVLRCPSCADRRQRLRALIDLCARAQPVVEDGAFVQEVLARCESPSPRLHPRTPLWPSRLGVATALAAGLIAALVVVMDHRDGEPLATSGTFSPRGGVEGRGPAASLQRRIGFQAHVHPQSDPAIHRVLESGGRVRAGDGFSFTIHNRAGEVLYAMLFAVDERGETHWFFPERRDALDDPRSIQLDGSKAVLPLPEGVTPEGVAPGALTIVGLFTPRPLLASAVEARLTSGGLKGPERLEGLESLATPGGVLQVLPLHLEVAR